MSKKKFGLSFRCYFPGKDNTVTHYQDMPLKDVPKWIEAYQFTHPNVESISVKIWFHGEEV